MRAAPNEDAECTNECLYGEQVQLASMPADEGPANQTLNKPANLTSNTEDENVWVLVTAARDGYSGYMQASHLQAVGDDTPTATHWVSTKTTLVFSQPNIKSRVVLRLPFLSRVASETLVDSSFWQLDTGDFVWNGHLRNIGQCIDVTAIELARTHFLGAPYLWGGRSPYGLDCSGLVQALAQAKGITIPRDSGDQEQALTNDIDTDHRQAQDIVYWPGHTGILLDSETILHATAHSLSCVVEPLQSVVDRAGEVSSVKRLF